MAAEYVDQLDEIYGLDKISSDTDAALADIERFLQGLTDADKKIKSMDFGFTGAASLEELKIISKQVDGLTAEEAKRVKDLADSMQKLSKARYEDARAGREQAKEAKELAREREILNRIEEKKEKQQKRDEAQAKKLKSAYERLKKEYNDTAAQALHLGAAHGVESQQAEEAASKAHALHVRLLELEKSVGRSQRQVGNYNIVGNEFNQIMRESANLGLGLRTFLVSITNNLTYFVEAVKKAVAQGATWKQILLQMRNSMFGLVGMVNLAIAAFTYFGLQALKSKDDTDDLKDSVDDLTASIAENIKVLERRRDLNREHGRAQASSEAALKREIDLLKAKGAAQGSSELDTQLKIHQKEKELFDLQIKNREDQKKAIEGIIYATNTLFKRYELQGYKSAYVIKAVSEDLIGTIMRQTKVSYEEAKKQAAAITKSYKDNNKVIVGLERERAEITKEINDLINEREINKIEFQKSINEQITQEEEDELEKRKKAHEKYIKEQEKLYDEWLKLHEKNYNAQFETQKQVTQFELEDLQSIINDQEASLDSRLDALTEFYSKKALLINETFEHEKNVGNKTAIEVEEIEKRKVNTLERLTKEVLDFEAMISKQSLERQREDEEKKRSNLQGLYDWATAQWKKTQDEEQKAHDKRIKNLQEYLKAAQTVLSIVTALQNGRHERYLSSLEREDEAIDRNEQREVSRIERSQATAEEKERAIRIEEAKSDFQRKNIEQRRAFAERKQAQYEKDIALFKILLNMYLGISKEVGTKGVAGLATSGAITAYVSGILAAAGTIAVPAYKDGGLHPRDGLAIVGDGGEHELGITKRGKMFLTPNTTTTTYMEAGTRIIPLSKVEDNLNYIQEPMSEYGISLMDGTNGVSYDNTAILGKLDMIINKPVDRTVFEPGGIYSSQVQGNRKTNRLRRNFTD